MSHFARFKSRVATGLLTIAALSFVASPAFAWWQTDFAYRTRIDVSPKAIAIADEVQRAPVLVRLHQGNFNFADMKTDGSDLRVVAGDDRTPLKFHIEKWAPAEQQALLWVDISNLKPDAATSIYIYYGNAEAASQADVAGTFGPEYQLVWHFDQAGPPKDATANGRDALSGGETRNANGLIGQSLLLDGSAPVALPPAIANSQFASVSFWVKPGAKVADGQLFNLPGALTLALQGGSLFVDINGNRSASAPLPADSWTHVALSHDGAKTVFYVNGERAGEMLGALPAVTGPAVLGTAFVGELDELRVAERALSPSVWKLAAASEGRGAKLLTFATAEQIEAGGHNYFGILFSALTADAWVVIGVLGLMMLLSWWVMASKGLMLSRVTFANDTFLEAYQRANVGHRDHDGLVSFIAAGGTHSSLARLYDVAKFELSKRLEESRGLNGRYVVGAQSIAAIRSALDAGHVRENQRLNRRMVFLTIAISGGPFLGLLGTVVGVMITFASVAAAGDVNINAIAPGIAAALLATVAGLAVAIPALFGYNYLLSRVEEIAADNQIFVDNLEKRIAETWQDRIAPSQVAPLAS